jgi:hypothetical protein
MLKSPSFSRLRLLPILPIGLRDFRRIKIVIAYNIGMTNSEIINKTELFL